MFVGTYMLFFYLGFLSDELIDKGFNEDYMGYVYGSNSICYFLGCFIYPYVKMDVVPRKF